MQEGYIGALHYLQKDTSAQHHLCAQCRTPQQLRVFGMEMRHTDERVVFGSGATNCLPVFACSNLAVLEGLIAAARCPELQGLVYPTHARLQACHRRCCCACLHPAGRQDGLAACSGGVHKAQVLVRLGREVGSSLHAGQCILITCVRLTPGGITEW